MIYLWITMYFGRTDTYEPKDIARLIVQQFPSTNKAFQQVWTICEKT